MITLYSKDFTTKYGAISSLCEAFIEEERNGLFELSFIMLNTDSLFNYVKEENIVVANANDTLLNQKFRIYMTRKLMNNRVEVFARHISFDLMYDYIDNLSFENQSCEYALNQLFRNSNFSTHYRGYSDIVNAQNYNMSMANVLEAIGGKKGSIVDTFGTGAEILRDNENIHVLNKRGYDNEVTIEYKKNLTGFELEEDTTDLVTRISPYAKYNDSETNEEIIVKADYVDSTLIANYSHPYIKSIDYSDKFEDGEIPTVSKLQDLARKEYKNNKVDMPKQNFKIEFIPLSKCVGYEGLEDKISLCDAVTIIDTRYNIKTQSKVIKTVFNVLKNRYESMELGEPRTSLGDVIGGGNNEPVVGPPGPQGPPGQDGSIEDFPNTLPSTPVLESFVYGFSNIELSWTFENKVYYSYELYGSKTKDFKPNTFDLIFEGQASTYMFQAKPNETWYFRVCAINTHGERTNFSNQVTVNTTKIEDLSNYVENMAISEALIGTLSLDRGWIGTLKGNYIDAKQLSVTNGNGIRTLDIDSFGNVSLDVTNFKLKSKNVALEDDINNLNSRVSSAEQKITDKAITSVVQESEFIKDIDGKISTNKSNISKVEQTASEINSTVSDLSGRYTELKQTVSGLTSTVADKVNSSDISSIIQQSSKDIQIGFNGINDRININPTSMDFRATNNKRDMSLFGGQVCIYNNINDTFMSTMGSVLKADASYKGVGFLLGKNANIFTIGRDATWTDVMTNRSPNPIHYITFNFDTNQADIDMQLNTNDINMRNCSLRNSIAVGTQKLQTNSWHDLSNNPLFTLNSYWGHIDMYQDLEANYNAILNARLVNPQNSYAISSGYNVDVKNDADVLIANEKISTVSENGEVNYDINEMIKLLYSKIHTLEKEIENLKGGV